MTCITEDALFLVFFLFPFCMVFYAASTVHHDKATSVHPYVCMDLECVLSALVGLSGLFAHQLLEDDQGSSLDHRSPSVSLSSC